MSLIKFGTDGWRAIIADTFTNANVARVAMATAIWLKQQTPNPVAVIGFDCRFGGEMFTQVAAKVLCGQGVKVYTSPYFATTPMVSLATARLGAQAGIVITASHNPPDYNGYKLKASFGGPASPKVIADIEHLIPEHAEIPTTSIEAFAQQGLLHYVDLEEMYRLHIEQHFDLEAIQQSGIRIAYDAMYGAGQSVMRKLLPNADFLHCDYNPSFKGQAPEPIHKNLLELSKTIADAKGKIQLGIATDGDADRIGLYDSKGNFVDSHHIILLLIHYLHRYKKWNGSVIIAFSVTDKVKKMCEAYGLSYTVTPIGFKYIAEYMVTDDVLLGGEESGGIAVKGHIPERDGIWMGLLILEFMAKTGKTLDELIAEVYEVVGPFAYNRHDLHITNELKNSVLERCKTNAFKTFGSHTIQSAETIDGFKYHLSNDSWTMIRASGTEPLLRIYGQAPTPAEVETLLEEVKQTLLA